MLFRSIFVNWKLAYIMVKVYLSNYQAQISNFSKFLTNLQFFSSNFQIFLKFPLFPKFSKIFYKFSNFPKFSNFYQISNFFQIWGLGASWLVAICKYEAIETIFGKNQTILCEMRATLSTVGSNFYPWEKYPRANRVDLAYQSLH